MTAKQWLKTPKGYMTAVLVGYLFIASMESHDPAGIGRCLIAVGVCTGMDILCCLVEKRKRIMPDGAVITGLIITLILSPTNTWYVAAATSAIAILSKHVLVYKKKPIFNPAALGLLLSIVLFQSSQSWWGAFGDFPAWNVVFLLIGGYVVANRVNKYTQVFSFLGMFFVLLLILGILNVGDASDALRPPFINAAFFFAFFMLTDPPTSPAKPKDQLIFGMLAAAASVIIYGYFGGLMYLYIGLLVGNLYHVIKIRYF